jgi:PIN domain nuclease of toxin-antitoxin system
VGGVVGGGNSGLVWLSRACSTLMFCCGLLHRDPFDRILIARSVVNQLPLVTGDTDIRKYKIDLRKASG